MGFKNAKHSSVSNGEAGNTESSFFFLKKKRRKKVWRKKIRNFGNEARPARGKQYIIQYIYTGIYIYNIFGNQESLVDRPLEDQTSPLQASTHVFCLGQTPASEDLVWSFHLCAVARREEHFSWRYPLKFNVYKCIFYRGQGFDFWANKNKIVWMFIFLNFLFRFPNHKFFNILLNQDIEDILIEKSRKLFFFAWIFFLMLLPEFWLKISNTRKHIFADEIGSFRTHTHNTHSKYTKKEKWKSFLQNLFFFRRHFVLHIHNHCFFLTCSFLWHPEI